MDTAWSILKMVTTKLRRGKIALWGIALGVGAWIISLGVLVGLSYAIADPSSISIENVRAYEDVLETDDLLVVVKYNLVYASTPTELINNAYVGRFVRGAEELNSEDPFPFNDNGYGVGVFSFYWTPDEVLDSSIEFSDPNAEGYSVNFQGKLGVFPGSIPLTSTTTITWRAAVTVTLSADILELAAQLEGDAAWIANSQDLVDAGEDGVVRLTSTGESYFASAIPGLASMAPLLFGSGLTPGPFFERDHDRAYSDSLLTLWDGNWVDTRFQNLADQFRVTKILVSTLFAFIIMLVVVWGAAKALGQTDRGIEFGILTIAVTLPLAISQGWVSMVVGGVVGLLAVLGLAWAFYGQRAGG